MKIVTKQIAGLAGLVVASILSASTPLQAQSPIALTPGGNSIFAGTAGSGGYGTTGTGKISNPTYVAVDSYGNVYWAELPYPSLCTTACTAGNVIRMATPAGVLSIVAGQVATATTAPGFGGDGTAATSVSVLLNSPRGVAVDSYGNIFISDSTNNRVRVVYGSGTGNPLATLIPAENSAWSSPVVGYIYTLAGGCSSSCTTNGSSLAYTQTISSPRGLWVSSSDDIYIACEGLSYVELLYNGGANAAALLAAEGITTTPTPGNMYYIGGTGGGGGATDSLDGSAGIKTGMPGPTDVAVDSSGNVYVAEYISGKIRKIMAVTVGSQTAGNVYTIGGQNSTSKTTAGFAGDGGLATAATVEFNTIRGLAIDAAANLYVADQGNYVIRKIDANGYINTIAGMGTHNSASTTPLPATASGYSAPYRAAVDPTTGNLYIADNSEFTIDKVNITSLAVASSFGTTANAEYTGSTAFGGVTLGTTSTGAIANISNISASSVTLSAITIPTGFLQLTTTTTPAGTLVPGTTVCNTTIALASGTSCTLDIAFVPTTATTYTSTATVTAGSYTISIPLSGTGSVTTPTLVLADGSVTSILSGTSITFTATLSPTTAPGTISFYDGANAITGCTSLAPSSGVANCTVTLPVGSDSISAIYTANNAGYANISSNSITVQVSSNVATTSTTLAGPSTATLGQSVTLTATIKQTSGTEPAPTGSVTFTDNGNTLGSGTVNTTAGTTTAAYTLTTLPMGINSITACYNGDTYNLPSCSTASTVIDSALQIVGIPGVISTVVGTGTMGNSTSGLATSALISSVYCTREDIYGNFYIADGGNTVHKVMASNKNIETIVGTYNSTTLYGGDNGPATNALINGAHGLALDAGSNLYISDTGNNRVRMVYEGGSAATALLVAEGVSSPVVGDIYTIAGNGNTSGGAISGTQAITQNLNSPRGIYVDNAGDLYITDYGNNRVRIVYAGGSAAASLINLVNGTSIVPVVGDMYVVAGNGTGAETGDNSSATAASLYNPNDVGFDPSGNFYIADYTGNKIRMVSAATGVITTFAGTGVASSGSSVGDGGLAVNATFNGPRGLWVDWAGNIYIADYSNDRIRKVDGNGYISTVAGEGTTNTNSSGIGDGGAATSAFLNKPFSIALDNFGNLIISDENNYRVRSVSPLSSKIAFPLTSVFSTSTLQTVLANVGSQSITLTGYTIPAPFSQTASGNTADAPDCTTTNTLAPAASCTLQVTFAPTSLAASTGTINVTSNAGTVSIALTGTGVVASTTTSLAASNSSPNSGTSVTFTATVTSTGGTPTGTVQFLDNGTTILAASQPLAAGVATFTTSTLANGPHTITAVYSGANGFTASTSNAVVVTVGFNGAATTTALSASTTTPSFGQNVTFTATVNAAAGSTTPAPTGNVNYYSNGILLGTQVLSGATATFSTTTLPVGSNSITADYVGDTNNLSSASAAVTVQVSVLQVAVTPGIISTVVGTGASGYTGDGGPATAAEIKGLLCARLDASGNLYITDGSYTVRVVNNQSTSIAIDGITIPAGAIETIAGTAGTSGYSGDNGPAVNALIGTAYGIAVDSAGNIYISDITNSRVRVIYEASSPLTSILSAEGYVSPQVGYIYTIAGSGTVTASNVLANSGQLNSPRQLLVDEYGNIYIPDYGTNYVYVVYAGGSAVASLITKENTGVVTPQVGYIYYLAGNGLTMDTLTGGPVLATTTAVDGPHGVALDASGNLYIVEYVGDVVREVNATNGMLTTIAGSGTAGTGGDGHLATLAAFTSPRSIVVDSGGNIYIADTGNNRIRKIDGNGYISSIAGPAAPGISVTNDGDGGAATSALIDGPNSIALNNSGTLIIGTNTDSRVRSINPVTSVLAFPSTGVGASSTLQAVLFNPGTQTVTLSAINLPAGFVQTLSGNTLDALDCSLTTSLAPAGSCTLQVAITPTATGAISTLGTVVTSAGTVTITLTGTGIVEGSITTLAASPTIAQIGNSVTLTATVTSANGIPYGTVNFVDSTTNTTLSAATLNASGVATYATTTLTAGNNSITAVYVGSNGFLPSTSSVVNVVVISASAVNTTTSLTASTPAANLGQSVILTAAATNGTASPPTGSVSFTDNGNPLGSVSVNASGVATLTISTLLVGSNAIVAAYNGDANDNPSVSSTVTVTVSVLQASVVTGIISTEIGNGIKGTTAAVVGDGGPPTAAEINAPYTARVDFAGNTYLSDANSTIRKVTASTGVISTIAGVYGSPGYFGDGGPATLSNINLARGLASDSAGNVYISDSGNNILRIIYAGGPAATAILNAEGITSPQVGYIYTIAGGGKGANGTLAINQSLNSPRGVIVDSEGNIYIADFSNNYVRVIYAGGSTVAAFITLENPTIPTPIVGGMYKMAGTGSTVDGADGGKATSSGIDNPHDVALDPSGNLYIAEFSGNKVREVNATTGFISTFAGKGSVGYTGDGGPATAATLNTPRGLWVDWAGNVYIADTGNNAVRMVTSSNGMITTIAGTGTASFSGDGVAAAAAALDQPYSVALDNSGDLIIADDINNRIRSVNAVNSVILFPTTLIGNTSASQTVSLVNIGNQPILPTAISVPAGYTLATGNATDCVLNTALAPGATCTLRVSATPTQSGLNIGTMAVTTNATNAPLGVVNVLLDALGSNPNMQASVVTLTVAPAANTAMTAAAVDIGQAVTLSAVAVGAIGGPLTIPTGKIVFESGSTVLGTVPLTGGGIANLSLSNFPLGTSSVTAIYDGDTVFNPAASSTVTVSVYNGPGDFTLGYGNINTIVNGVTTAVPDKFATVIAGSSALYILTATSLNGFDQGVALNCSGLPPFASCSFSPALVIPVVGTTYSFGLAINTTNLNVSNGPHASLGDSPMLRRMVVGAPLLALLFWLPLYPARIRRRMRGAALLFVLCLSVMSVLTGCSSINSPIRALTPTGTYTITVNGLANNATHSETVTLTVQ